MKRRGKNIKFKYSKSEKYHTLTPGELKINISQICVNKKPDIWEAAEILCKMWTQIDVRIRLN